MVLQKRLSVKISGWLLGFFDNIAVISYLHLLFSLALARDRSLVTDVLVLPLDITEYNKHKDHAQTVMNHFNRVGISTIYVYFVCKDEMC